MQEGSPVVQVSLADFQARVPNMIPDLKTETTESETHRWKFYIYNASEFIYRQSCERWARWLTHRDLRAISNCWLASGTGIVYALTDAGHIGDPVYQDASVDAWMLWLQRGQPAGKLDVELLRFSRWMNLLWTGRLEELNCALILHHDAGAVTMEDDGDLHKSPYDHSICRRVCDLALTSFAQPDRRLEDPLRLSDKEFCEKYHAHSSDNQPCYKTKHLPEQP